MAAILGALGLVAGLAFAVPAAATPGPIVQRSGAQPTADALPTTQVDGVVWSQAVVGNTVYAGGSFGTARPAGAAPGVSTVVRSNLLSYDITTGVLNTGFAPSLNGQVLAVAASPDGSRIYVGGDFTTINGTSHQRIVAFSTATGAVITSFAVSANASVRAIYATNDTVYVGGAFSVVGTVDRARLAAFSAASGAVLPWNPSTDAQVNAMVGTPNGSSVIVGGSFANVGGTPQYGMASVSATTGAVQPWAANLTVRDAGVNSAIESLTTDGTAIYNTGYVFGAGGNLEGTFKADPVTGAVLWVEDCHGDTYDNYVTGGAVYVVSHSHYCGNDGAFPQPDVWVPHHATAFTVDATGTLKKERYTYTNWQNTPAPSQLNWYPDMDIGSYTGKDQAAWSISGNSQYVVLGGEFPTVNGVGQQGLVRFAVPSLAPKKQGPMVSGNPTAPHLVSLATGTVRVAFQSNWDRDDKTLTYRVLRDGNPTPVYATISDSEFWNRPYLGFVDSGLVPGSRHTYQVYVSDPDGNTVVGVAAGITVPSTAAISSYAARVIADGASTYWPLNEASGSTAYDEAGYNDASATLTRGAAGAIPGEGASTLTGATNSIAWANSLIDAPDTYTESVWINTTTTRGGQLVGFGSAQLTASVSHDRQVWLDNAGRVYFGAAAGILSSTATVNDGRWHQIAVSLGAGGMSLYIDGLRVARRTDIVAGAQVSGYWRVGGDSLTGRAPRPTSDFLAGTVAGVAIFPTELSGGTVAAEYAASGRAVAAPAAPADVYGNAVFNDDPELWWRLDEGAGSTAVASSGRYANPGDLVGTGTTLGAPGALASNGGTAAALGGGTGFLVGRTAYANPTTVSEEVWFKTTTTRGGELLGLSGSRSGNSTSFDRQIVMQTNGTLQYAVYNGSRVTVTTPRAYNDGLWHQAVAVLSGAGMQLYVDGALIGSNPNTISENATGYWRVGGDATWATTNYFAGSIDEVAVYTRALTAAQISRHYSLGTTGQVPNVPPVAAFTSSSAALALSVDGSGSSDPDGTIASYAWTFGDGGTASGMTAAHSYAAAGNYPVMLTVTDDRGGVTSLTKTVTVTVTQLFAADGFGRSVSAGWGAADTGGAWTVSGGAANFTADGISGRANLANLGSTTAAYLNSVSARDVTGTVDVALNSTPTGGGVYLSIVARHSGTSDYRVRLRLQPTATTLILTKLVNNVETTLKTAAIPGLTAVAGDVLRIRLQLTGTGTSTLSGKVWRVGTAEPAAFQATATDTEASLQGAGGVGLLAYLSASSTVAPVVAAFDNLSVTSVPAA